MSSISQQWTELRLFNVKLNFGRCMLKKGNVTTFQLWLLIESNQEDTDGDISQLLNGLQQAFQKDFSSSTSDASCVQNPYRVSEKPDGMPVQNYECLKDTTSDTSLKQRFIELPLVEFRCSLLQEYSQFSEGAVLRLLPSSTNELCQAGCSRLAVTKSEI